MHDSSLYIRGGETCAVFPLWDFSGRMVGYHQYRSDMPKDADNHPYDSKYFTRVQKVPHKFEPFWGVHSTYFSNTLFLTEGLFDAARLQEAGFAAWCVFANNPKNSAFLNLMRKVRPVVAVCDGDKAGMKLANSAHRSLVLADDRDANDYTASELRELLHDF